MGPYAATCETQEQQKLVQQLSAGTAPTVSTLLPPTLLDQLQPDQQHEFIKVVTQIRIRLDEQQLSAVQVDALEPAAAATAEAAAARTMEKPAPTAAAAAAPAGAAETAAAAAYGGTTAAVDYPCQLTPALAVAAAPAAVLEAGSMLSPLDLISELLEGAGGTIEGTSAAGAVAAPGGVEPTAAAATREVAADAAAGAGEAASDAVAGAGGVGLVAGVAAQGKGPAKALQILLRSPRATAAAEGGAEGKQMALLAAAEAVAAAAAARISQRFLSTKQCGKGGNEDGLVSPLGQQKSLNGSSGKREAQSRLSAARGRGGKREGKLCAAADALGLYLPIPQQRRSRSSAAARKLPYRPAILKQQYITVKRAGGGQQRVVPAPAIAAAGLAGAAAESMAGLGAGAVTLGAGGAAGAGGSKGGTTGTCSGLNASAATASISLKRAAESGVTADFGWKRPCLASSQGAAATAKAPASNRLQGLSSGVGRVSSTSGIQGGASIVRWGGSTIGGQVDKRGWQIGGNGALECCPQQVGAGKDARVVLKLPLRKPQQDQQQQQDKEGEGEEEEEVGVFWQKGSSERAQPLPLRITVKQHQQQRRDQQQQKQWPGWKPSSKEQVEAKYKHVRLPMKFVANTGRIEKLGRGSSQLREEEQQHGRLQQQKRGQPEQLCRQQHVGQEQQQRQEQWQLHTGQQQPGEGGGGGTVAGRQAGWLEGLSAKKKGQEQQVGMERKNKKAVWQQQQQQQRQQQGADYKGKKAAPWYLQQQKKWPGIGQEQVEEEEEVEHVSPNQKYGSVNYLVKVLPCVSLPANSSECSDGGEGTSTISLGTSDAEAGAGSGERGQDREDGDMGMDETYGYEEGDGMGEACEGAAPTGAAAANDAAGSAAGAMSPPFSRMGCPGVPLKYACFTLPKVPAEARKAAAAPNSAQAESSGTGLVSRTSMKRAAAAGAAAAVLAAMGDGPWRPKPSPKRPQAAAAAAGISPLARPPLKHPKAAAVATRSPGGAKSRLPGGDPAAAAAAAGFGNGVDDACLEEPTLQGDALPGTSRPLRGKAVHPHSYRTAALTSVPEVTVEEVPVVTSTADCAAAVAAREARRARAAAAAWGRATALSKQLAAARKGRGAGVAAVAACVAGGIAEAKGAAEGKSAGKAAATVEALGAATEASGGTSGLLPAGKRVKEVAAAPLTSSSSAAAIAAWPAATTASMESKKYR